MEQCNGNDAMELDGNIVEMRMQDVTFVEEDITVVVACKYRRRC